jgi:hypothetical protein
LPGGTGQVRRDRLDQPLVGVGGDQADPGQTAGDQVSEELVPRCPGLGGGHAQAQDLTVPVTVDAGRDEHDRVDHPSAFSHFHGERVGSHERERSRRIEWAVTEGLDMLVEVGSHPRHL